VTGRFRFDLESANQVSRIRDDLVAAIALDASSVHKRELIVLSRHEPNGVNHAPTYLTIRSNHP